MKNEASEQVDVVGTKQQFWFDPRGHEQDTFWQARYGYLMFWLEKYLAENEKVARSKSALLVIYKNWEKICPVYVNSVATREGMDMLLATTVQ